MTKVQNDSLRFDEKTAPDNFLQRAQIFTLIWRPNLTTFGRASVPQRLINHSLYQEILLLQKFNDIGGKVLKPKKSASNLR